MLVVIKKHKHIRTTEQILYFAIMSVSGLNGIKVNTEQWWNSTERAKPK
jgi:hypothetical protein